MAAERLNCISLLFSTPVYEPALYNITETFDSKMVTFHESSIRQPLTGIEPGNELQCIDRNAFCIMYKLIP